MLPLDSMNAKPKNDKARHKSYQTVKINFLLRSLSATYTLVLYT
jgi:hypothetical protein